jgi:hypothetical protein
MLLPIVKVVNHLWKLKEKQIDAAAKSEASSDINPDINPDLNTDPNPNNNYLS